MGLNGDFEEIFKIRANRLDAGCGNVLIAEPFMQGLFFSRAVVYLVEHGGKGSIGYILNKPTPYTVSRIIPELKGVEFTVYVGGPVHPDRLFYIHSHPEVMNGVPVADGIYWGGDFAHLCRLLADGRIAEDEIRFFAGYSGWESGQLEDELKDNSWMVGSVPNDKFFKIPDDDLWSAAMGALGGRYRIWAGFPDNPMMN